MMVVLSVVFVSSVCGGRLAFCGVCIRSMPPFPYF